MDAVMILLLVVMAGLRISSWPSTLITLQKLWHLRFKLFSNIGYFFHKHRCSSCREKHLAYTDSVVRL
jgi:hypothetical protein